MIKALTKKIFGEPSERIVKKMKPMIDQINSLESKMKVLSNEELALQTQKFKKLLDNGEDTKNILPEGFCNSKRSFFESYRDEHFDVQ